VPLNLDEIRYAALCRANLPVPRYIGTVKLPTDFSIDEPFAWVSPQNGKTYQVKIMSQVEARIFSPKAAVAHRILIRCEFCNYWHFAGKLIQHQKFCRAQAQLSSTEGEAMSNCILKQSEGEKHETALSTKA
jgi:hypothetical protein